jgi:hypothetical protein
VHGLCQMYYRLKSHFGRTRWYSCLMRLKWKLVSFHLEIVLTLTQDRCTVCAERTMDSKIILEGDMGHGGSYFGPLEMVLLSVQDRCTVRAKRTIGLKIILDEADGTPR